MIDGFRIARVGRKFSLPLSSPRDVVQRKTHNRTAAFFMLHWANNVRPWWRHRLLGYSVVLGGNSHSIYSLSGGLTYTVIPATAQENRMRTPHWPILERANPRRRVFDLTIRANQGPKTSPHRKGKYAAPDDWCGYETIRNVDRKETLRFRPFRLSG